MADRAWRSAVERVRQLQTRHGRHTFGCYTVEGTRHVERALRAAAPIEQIVVGESFIDSERPRIRALRSVLAQEDARVVVAPDNIIHDLTGGRGLGQVIAIVEMPANPSLASLLSAQSPALLLIALDVVEPGNVGAMLRTAHALQAAVVCVGVSDPFHPKAVRTSMGSIFKCSFAWRDAGDAWWHELEKLKLLTVATVAAGGTPLPQFTFDRSVALLLGDEYHGLSEDVVGRADRRVTIPMASGIDSLSVSHAAAIIVYEARRQMGWRDA